MIGLIVNSRFLIGFGQKANFDRIGEFLQRLESDGDVGVLPTRFRLELVEQSHGFLTEDRSSYKEESCRTIRLSGSSDGDPSSF